MKLKQALIIGLSSAVLAIPAIAAESATDLNSLPTANAHQAAAATPAKEDTVNQLKKDQKKVSLEEKTDTEQAEENAKLDELNVLNSQAEEKDQTEKNSIDS